MRCKQAESLKVAKWRKDECMIMMKDDDFKLLRVFADWQTNGQTNGQSLLRLKVDKINKAENISLKLPITEWTNVAVMNVWIYEL